MVTNYQQPWPATPAIGFCVLYECQLMSIPILFQVYDYDNDRCVGTFADYNEAEITCAEYQSNYGEPVEVLVEEIEEYELLA